MPYAFNFDAYNDKVIDEDGYSARKDNVYVVVIAPDLDTATEAAKSLLDREHYKLDRIEELTELNTAGR